MVATKPKRRPLSRTLDKHVLYQLSVQAPETDSVFFARHYRKLTGRHMEVFREDFCGTATLSCHVVKNNSRHRAVCVDLDGPTLAWAREHNLSQLNDEQRSRVQLLQKNVLDVRRPAADLIAALNFSYCVFRTRGDLLSYFKNAHRSLCEDGVFIIDVWGGAETMLEQEEEREVDEGGIEFTYIWDQASFDPLTHHAVCKIHFELEDGSRINNAFIYEWRLWTLPELQELMTEAGFRDLHVLWEGTDRETNEGNGVFRRVTKGEADPAWIAYLVGQR